MKTTQFSWTLEGTSKVGRPDKLVKNVVKENENWGGHLGMKLNSD